MVNEVKKSKPLIFKLRNYFTTGLILMAPSAISVWILVQVFRWFDNILGKWYTRLFDYLNAAGGATFHVTYLPGMGAVTLIVLITLFGFFTRQYAGKKLFSLWEQMINQVPLINRIYLAIRQLSDSFAQGGAIIFERPVMIEYPRKGLYSIGFVTRDCGAAFCNIIGTKVSTVFIPTTPNPTSGVLIFVPRDEMIPLKMTIEDAMKLIISAGVVTPDIKLPE